MKPSQDLIPSDGLPSVAWIAAGDGRLVVDTHPIVARRDELARDVRSGLLAAQKTLPPKYFYDDHGSRLFDAICDLPEYYLTRTEHTLLETVAEEIVRLTQPADVVEFGSGASRKTRVLLDALTGLGQPLRYVPFDVSEGMLRRAAAALLRDYPQLCIHAVVGDYERDLARIPSGWPRLVLFLGSTIGNFTPAATAHFLRSVRQQLALGDHLLLGVDLVKPVEILEAAYNDRAGVTAEFNRNVLHVINRELDANFVPERFEHIAFFSRTQSQIEMHLRARTAHAVAVRRLGLRVSFVAGETIHTEISRKFTADQVRVLLQAAGFDLARWYAPENNFFGLALARATA